MGQHLSDLSDFELPRSRVAVLLDHFSDLGDEREPQRVRYPLHEVLLLVTCATICSCDDFDEIAVSTPMPSSLPIWRHFSGSG